MNRAFDALRTPCLLAGCLLLLLATSGCYIAAPKPDKDLYGETAATAGGETTGLPLVDPDFRLAPNDLIGVTYISKDTPEGYPLQTADTLLVEYHQQEHLNRNVVVRPDGKVTLPYIGDVQATGGTVDELAAEIASRYKKASIFENLTTTVSLLTFNNKLRELQAINNNSTAGQTREVSIGNDGYLELPLGVRVFAAGKTLKQLREEVCTSYAKELAGIEVHTELRAMRSSFIFVLGEVNSPGLVAVAGPGGIVQAVASAGGFKNTADLASVVVLRSNPDCDAPVGRLVDVDTMLKTGNLSRDVMIRRFDVVYVPASKIKTLNDKVLFYIRNMMPVETTANLGMGFNYMWGDTNGSTFGPF